jgi:hypothetical protein
MEKLLRQVELFRDLSSDGLRRVLAIGKGESLDAGQHLFLLGDDANELFVVLRGSLNLCLPIALHGSVKDITVESVGAGQALGWSALVRPYRFTLSARLRDHGPPPGHVPGALGARAPARAGERSAAKRGGEAVSRRSPEAGR